MSDEANTTTEPPKETPTEPKPEPPKEKSNEKKSTTQLMKDEVAKLFSEGWQVNEKSDKIKLNKQIRQNLKLKSGWSTDINNAIQEHMEKNKLKINDGLFKDSKIGGMTVVLSSPETEPESTGKVKSNVSQSPMGALPQSAPSKGALPKTTGSSDSTTETESIEPEKKYMSSTARSELIHFGLEDILFGFYKTMGWVELSEEEEKAESKPMKIEDAKKQWSDLADKIDKVCEENNIQLPAFLNWLSLGGSIFAVLLMPVIKHKMFNQNNEPEPDYDADAENIEVKA